ncbi:MAG: Holliday junction resolvase RuvX [Acidobacteria bacterium]|nr:Holliday junction resolvase RuvX [Acidobacteriota bacterium]
MGWLGIDFGARRIGVAVSSSGIIAEPHSVIRRGDDLTPVIETIARIAGEYEATTIVVGIPKGGRRAPSDNLPLYEAFAETLRSRLAADVVLWDESYSTTEAASRLRETGKPLRDARARIDMLAAAVILQSYLDSGRNGA